MDPTNPRREVIILIGKADPEHVTGRLFGSYRWINEYLVGCTFKDARASRIGGGTSEIAKVIIARSLPAFKPSLHAQQRSADALGWNPV